MTHSGSWSIFYPKTRMMRMKRAYDVTTTMTSSSPTRYSITMCCEIHLAKHYFRGARLALSAAPLFSFIDEMKMKKMGP